MPNRSSRIERILTHTVRFMGANWLRPALVVAVLALIAYWNAGDNGFVEMDEGRVLVRNPHIEQGLSWDAVRWAFTDTEFYDYWHPLPWLSHIIDIELFGMAPRGHHVTNVVLHMLNAVLLLIAIGALVDNRGAGFVAAAVFAVHPLHVEAVAWVIERKELLCMLFWLLALIAYARYAHKPTVGRALVPLGCVALSMMSKPMLVASPVLLLLADIWPLRRVALPGRWSLEVRPGVPRVSFGRVLLEKVPYAALAAAMALLTFVVTAGKGGVASLTARGPVMRIMNATVSYATYLRNMIWPVDLAPLYPYPDSIPVLTFVLAVTVVAGVVALGAHLWPKFPALGWGWAWLMTGLVPVIGIVQTGDQAMADRFTYTPSLGLYALAGLLAAGAWRRRAGRLAVCVVLPLLVAVLVFLTHRQVAVWRNTETLFTHAIHVGGGSRLAHNNLGGACMEQGRVEEALEHYKKAIEFDPHRNEAFHNCGVALTELGRWDEAVQYFRRSLERDPDYFESHIGYARALLGAGDTAGALTRIESAAAVGDSLWRDQNTIGATWLQAGQLDSAEAALRKSEAANPARWEPYNNLGLVFMQRGAPAVALPYFARASSLAPQRREPFTNAGMALLSMGRPTEAVASLTESLARDTTALALANRGVAFEQLGQLDSALVDLEKASRSPVHQAFCAEAIERIHARRDSLQATGQVSDVQG